jgi:putative membrane protein
MHEAHLQDAGFGPVASLLPLGLIAGMLIAYVAAVAWLPRTTRRWSRWRTVSFVGGVCLLGVAMLPSLAKFAHQDVRGHMIQHLLIGMLSPLGLVLGAPITLALKTLPVKAGRVVTTVLRSRPFHLLSHPVAALLLNIGGMYLLYLTPLYALTLTQPYLHHAVHLHFLAAGCLFTWSVAGPDPAPRRPGLRTRLIVLFMSIAAHASLSKFMYAYLWPRNTPHPEDQIRAAAKLMYYGGDLAELLLLIALFAMWYQKRGRPQYELPLRLPEKAV